MALTDNLIAYYSLEDNAANTTVVDDTATLNATASANTSTLTTTGKVNDAFLFNGTTEEVSRAIGAIPTGASARSFNCWFNFTSLSGANTNPLISYGAFSAGLLNIIDVNDGGAGNKLRFWGHSNDVSGTTTINTGTWYMGTVTYDGTTIKVYLNGGFENSTTATLNTSSSTVYFASHHLLGNEFSNTKMDEIGIWTRALLQSEITDLYNSNNGLAYPLNVPIIKELSGTVGLSDSIEYDIIRTKVVNETVTMSDGLIKVLTRNLSEGVSIADDVAVPSLAQSLSIDFNNGTITTAKMTVTRSASGDILLYLSADGGNNWEQVTSGVAHTFVNTGTDLRWRIKTSDETITKVLIEDYH